MRGRWWWQGSWWWWWQMRRNTKSTTSGSRLDAREVVVVARELVVVANASKREKHHLRLAFGCEGGGGRGKSIKMREKTTSGSRLDAREVEVVAASKTSASG